MNRVVVDPVTRIEGHLRIEALTGGDGAITEAYSSGTMVRGIELILHGRDPRDAWAFAQRICGVCTLVHGLASVRAVEDALDYPIPPNARLIRNLMNAAQHVHDHVMHFYHLHALDWVDVVAALKADPKATSALAQSVSGWAKSSPGYFAETKKRLGAFVEAGQLGIFRNGYWGHPGYRLPAEANLMALAHFFEGLAWQREVVKLHAIFGGKNPHPNFLVGGMACAISVDPNPAGHGSGPRHHGGSQVTAVDSAGLQKVRAVIEAMREFVEQVYVPDVLAIAGFYPEWFRQGEGLGNFMTYGDFPARSMADPAGFLVPRGVILGRDLTRVHELDLAAPDQIQEFIPHSWYAYRDGAGQGLHPYAGETALNYTGPAPPYRELDLERPYSWLKSPRWKGRPVEVGPLARLLMLYATGHEPTRALADATLARLGLPPAALYSTLGRTLARALETRIFVDAMRGWYDELLANIKAGDLATHNAARWAPAGWPREARGVGFTEAPRGALGHWIVIRDGRIANYQAVVPSTWNAGPRDTLGQPGAYEAALAGHALHDTAQPLEILRTIHSFDPCIACAVHVAQADGGTGH